VLRDEQEENDRNDRGGTDERSDDAESSADHMNRMRVGGQ